MYFRWFPQLKLAHEVHNAKQVDTNPRQDAAGVTWEITEERIQLISDASLFGFLKFV